MQLDGALNNMIQGLCMFDAQNRLMVWNERYQTMYSIDPRTNLARLHDSRPARRAHRGRNVPARSGTLRRLNCARRIKQGKTFTLNIELKDGRTIAVVNQPIEGGGWVATHEDITERKRAERELEHTRSFLDTIIENVPSPIIVKDIPEPAIFADQPRRREISRRRPQRHARQNRRRSHAEGQRRNDRSAKIRKLIALGKSMFLDEHAIVTPGNGTRIVTATRLPVMGADGKAAIPHQRHPRRHRPQARRAAHRAHGASRFADRPAESRGVQRMHRRHARSRGAFGRKLRRALHRSRPLQDGQRRVRPFGRRCAAARSGAPAGNGRVRAHSWRASAATNSRSSRRPGRSRRPPRRWPSGSAPRSMPISTSTAIRCGWD